MHQVRAQASHLVKPTHKQGHAAVLLLFYGSKLVHDSENGILPSLQHCYHKINIKPPKQSDQHKDDSHWELNKPKVGVGILPFLVKPIKTMDTPVYNDKLNLEALRGLLFYVRLCYINLFHFGYLILCITNGSMSCFRKKKFPILNFCYSVRKQKSTCDKL